MSLLCRITLVVVFVFTFAGCSDLDNGGDYKRVCIDGVTYIYMEKLEKGFFSVALNRDSQIIECEEKTTDSGH